MPIPAEQSIIRWLASNHASEPGKALAFWVAFNMLPQDISHPTKPKDLYDCIKLLQCAPGLRAQLNKMHQLSASWRQIVTHWEDLEQCLLSEIDSDWELNLARTANQTHAMLDAVLAGTHSTAATTPLTTTQQHVLDWLATGETDRSSETMALWLAFNIRKEDHDHPWDPDELNRCIKLLFAAPGLKNELGKLGELSAEWGRLGAHWDALQNSFFAEAGYDWCRGSSAPGTAEMMIALLEDQPLPEEMIPN